MTDERYSQQQQLSQRFSGLIMSQQVEGFSIYPGNRLVIRDIEGPQGQITQEVWEQSPQGTLRRARRAGDPLMPFF